MFAAPPPPPPYTWTTRDVVVQSVGTDRQWWLKATVDQVNRTGVVRLRFGTCDGVVQCIRVSSTPTLEHPDGGLIAGMTYVSVQLDTRKIVNASIFMGDQVGSGLTYREHRTALNHEFLHALGMSHDNNAASVLTPYVEAGAVNIGAWDTRKLTNLYRNVP